MLSAARATFRHRRLPRPFRGTPATQVRRSSLHETLTHRRCGAPFLALWCGEEREPESNSWLRTRWVLIPLTDDELADMECTPTAILGDRRQKLVPTLRAEQWLWLTEGPERGEGRWRAPLAGVAALSQLPTTEWPTVPDEPLPAAGSGRLHTHPR